MTSKKRPSAPSANDHAASVPKMLKRPSANESSAEGFAALASTKVFAVEGGGQAQSSSAGKRARGSNVPPVSRMYGPDLLDSLGKDLIDRLRSIDPGLLKSAKATAGITGWEHGSACTGSGILAFVLSRCNLGVGEPGALYSSTLQCGLILCSCNHTILIIAKVFP